MEEKATIIRCQEVRNESDTVPVPESRPEEERRHINHNQNEADPCPEKHIVLTGVLFCFCFFNYLFIYMTALGLSCGTQNL